MTADRRAEEQAELLRRRGARVVHGPTIRTLPLGPDGGLRGVTESLIAAPPDVVIANTGIGMRSWFAAAESWGRGEALTRALSRARIYARGPKAAGAVLVAGLPLTWRAPSETLAEVIAHVMRTEPVVGLRIAFQLHGDPDEPRVSQLRDAGADVAAVPVYRWTPPGDRPRAMRIVDAACAGRLDAVTFTSSPAVDNLFTLAEERDRATELRDALNGGVLPMCMGPVCAETAARRGVDGVQPVRPRLGSMVHTLTERLAARQRRLRLGSADAVMQGALLLVGDRRVSLTNRERAVMELLTRRPGALVSRAELLRAVWGAATADEHALEMTVTRLRRRLGRAGRAVETVVRRGYRLDATPR